MDALDERLFSQRLDAIEKKIDRLLAALEPRPKPAYQPPTIHLCDVQDVTREVSAVFLPVRPPDEIL